MWRLVRQLLALGDLRGLASQRFIYQVLGEIVKNM
jgi:hypothetical protein